MSANDYFQNAKEPWVNYKFLIDLLGLDPSHSTVQTARKAMLEHPLIQSLLEELKRWPGTVLNSHKSAQQLYHKVEFLADLGLSDQEDPIGEVLNQMKEHLTSEGIPCLPMQISVSHGGSDTPTWAWALCDAPVQLYALVKMSAEGIDPYRPAIETLIELVQTNGWGCHVSKELGKFRGPGKKADPCPYATLVMLKLLSHDPLYSKSEAATKGLESLLFLWDNSKTEHPYQFYMGTDFRKLKAPFIWYDILHVTEVLSRYEVVHSDPRFMEMFHHILAKADHEGHFTAESVWQAWKGWDFAQKEIPSPWLTLMVEIIKKRINNNKNITKTMI